jgi:hypothetical protein
MDAREKLEALRAVLASAKAGAELLIEVPMEEDWEQGMPEDLFRLLRYAEYRSCSWVLLGPERAVNEDLPTYPIAGDDSGDTAQ